tara:strand:+ start:539 stop:751 length:213 start_codon:yes stop_codon:yes gene_type:complete
MNLQEWKDLAIQRSFDLERAVEKIERQDGQLTRLEAIIDIYETQNRTIKGALSLDDCELRNRLMGILIKK